MTWFFQKASERLQYEIRREYAGGSYEVVITGRGTRRVETHETASKLLRESESFWNSLLGEGWQPLDPQFEPVSA
jgi:hypothetical protein